MKINLATEYKKHGLSLSGVLAVIEYYEDMQADPNWGAFGSMLPFDYAEKAEELLRETYPDAVILLSVPDVVARI